MRYLQLQYDIPKRCRCPNPSPWLYRVAIRTTGSVWVLRPDNVPYNRLNRMTERGARWWIIAFDQDEEAKVYAMLCQCLTERIERELVGRNRRLEREAARLDESGNGKRYGKRVDDILRSSRGTLESLAEAAKLFNIDTVAANSLRDFGALASIWHARAGIYAGLTAAVEGTNLEPAALDDAIPGPILSDAVEDATGADMTGVQEVFAGTV